MALVLKRSWGSTGSGDGEFNGPYRIFVYLDEVYVSDSNNNRIQVFNTAGVYQRQWGTAGSGDGEFVSPYGICVYLGEVYVMDSGNTRVQVFNTAGVYQRKWGSDGTGNGQFKNPTGINIYGGEVYTSDGGVNNRIQVFNTAGVYQRKWGSTGSGDGQFDIPVDVFGYSFEIFVADQNNNRIQVFDTSGVYQRKWTDVWVDGLFVYSGKLYSVNTVNANIYSDLIGTLEETIAGLSFPVGIAFYNDEIYITNTSNDEIFVYGETPPTEPTNPETMRHLKWFHAGVNRGCCLTRR